MTTPPPRKRGRPPRDNADSHDAILCTVEGMLRKSSFRDLTMEAIARRAKVGKPTLYRWWPTKAALVASMFSERVVPKLPVADGRSLEELLRLNIEMAIDAFNGFFGKVVAELVADAQSDADTRSSLLEAFVKPRRGVIEDAIRDAQQQGLATADIEPSLVVDLVFGPIYYNHLLKVRPLTQAYGKQLLGVAKALLRL